MTKDEALNYVLFAVEQSIRNGSCYWEIEDAFSDYESISKEALAQPAQSFVEHDKAVIAKFVSEQKPVAKIDMIKCKAIMLDTVIFSSPKITPIPDVMLYALELNK